jgi:hypothetical protein
MTASGLGSDAASGDPPAQYVVTAANTTVLDTEQLSQYGDVGVRVNKRVEISMPARNRTALGNIPWVTDIRPVIRPEPAAVPGSSNGSSLGVEQIHTAGITGDGVTVGVIDAGFDMTNPTIQDNIVANKSFTMTQRDPAHGTSVAEIVTRTAPESDLHLVSAKTGVQSERAIEYLTEHEVDVIVASWGFLAIEDDGDHFLTDEITQAEAAGTLFVASAGNHAETHWEGAFRSTDGDRAHEWTNEGVERNCIPDCQTEFSGSIDVYLRWDETGDPSEYQLGLYNPNTQEYVATEDTVERTETNKYVRLSTTVSSQPLDLVVEHTAGAPDDEIEIVVNNARGLATTVPESSIAAPADVPSAFSIAAYEVGSERVAPYSSQGPTDDSRQGIDMTGYTNIQVENGLYGQTRYVFRGTSAAAPYVGGVAALATAQSGDSPTDGVATTLRSTSDDILAAGPDPIAGVGVVNAVAATDAGDEGSGTDAATMISGDPDTALYQGTGNTAYQGQRLLVTGAGIESSIDSYGLRRVDTTDSSVVETSSRVESLQTFVVGEDDDALPAYADPGTLSNGTAFLVLETDDRQAGAYFVQGGNLPETPETDAGTFDLRVQSLSLKFGAGATVPNTGANSTTELQVDSNRTEYNANLSARGELNTSSLLDILITTENVPGETVAIDGNNYTDSAVKSAVLDARGSVTTNRDGGVVVNDAETVEVTDTTGARNTVEIAALLATDANPFNALAYTTATQHHADRVVLVNSSNPASTVSFAGVEPGEYTFTVETLDTTATTSATLGIEAPATGIRLTASSVPTTATPDDDFQIGYVIENTGATTTAYTLTSTSNRSNVTVTDFAGDIQSSSLDATPSSTLTDAVAAGSNATVTATYRATADTTGSVNITATAHSAPGDARNTTSSEILIDDTAIVPQDPTDRALQITGKASPAELTQNDVTVAITRFARDEPVNRIEITQNDITTIITLFERY